MKRIALIATITLVMIGLFVANQTMLLAESPVAGGETMLTANQFYENGQFPLAAQAYEQLVGQGYADDVLFYNLGNAYFRQGDYGRAILNYRRAQRLAPRDPDVRTNLALARAQVADSFEASAAAAGRRALPDRLGRVLQEQFTLNELAMAALGAWILLVFLLILFSSAKAGSSWRNGLRYALIVVAVVLALGILALGSSLYVASNQSEGVVVAAEVDVTSGPGAQHTAEFTLYGGTEVDLIETRGNWVRLALAGGDMQGWVLASAVEAVNG
jgi:hypothetical protein